MICPRKSLVLAAVTVTTLLGPACGRVDEIRRSASEKIGESDIRRDIEEVYQKVKSTGAEVPDSAIAWAAEDISRIGDWDYKVVSLEPGSPAEIETRLNDYGSDRWEVFWVEESGEGRTLFMKRTARSYLRHFPLREVLKALPVEGGE